MGNNTSRQLGQEHRLWLKGLDRQARNQFLVPARQRMANKLASVEESNEMQIDRILLLHIALEPAVLKLLRRGVAKAESMEVFRDRETDNHEVALNWNPAMPSSVYTYVVNSIAKILLCARRLTRLHSCWDELMTLSVVAACPPQLEILRIRINRALSAYEIVQLTNGILKHKQTLQQVELHTEWPALFIHVGPILETLPHLKRLWLAGLGNSLTRIPPDVATAIGSLIRHVKPDYLKLIGMMVASRQACDIICSSLQHASVHELVLLCMPFINPLQLATALAESPTKRLSLLVTDTGALDNETIEAFISTLAHSKSSELEALFISTDDTSLVSLDFFESKTFGMESFHHILESNGPVQFANVFAVNPTIVFEYLRRDKWGLQKAMLGLP
ncbi:hypothetical protein MPSEU_000159200 [Mayamaea pseudoterrestris]|nr:hypothetical protein MPSEU_000159200 [Mayamaea pseudoterrestris]